MKRISFTEAEASHIYEWLRMFWDREPDVDRFGYCGLCERIGLRLERLIGKREVRRIARAVRKHPGQ